MKFRDFFRKKNIEEQKSEIKQKSIEIEIAHSDSFTKVSVGDYYTIQDYVEKMRKIDTFGIENLLNNSVVWNSGRQKVNKGTYYVFRCNGALYNILVNEEQVRIDERTPIGEEIANKVLTFKNSKYQYFRCIHDKNGSSRACRYYDLKDNDLLPLTRDEFLTDFNAIIHNLSDFNGIENMIDLHKLENIVSQTTCDDLLSI